MTKKSKGRTKRDAAKAELHRAHTKDDGSHYSFDLSGFKDRSDWHKAQKKHKKDYPQLVKNIEVDAWKDSQSKKGLWSDRPKVDKIHKKRSQHSIGGGVGIQTHGNKLARALNTKTPDHSKFLNEYGYLKGGVPVKNG